MIKLAQDERRSIAEKIMEWGNLACIGFFVSQFVPGPPKSGVLVLVGFALQAGCFAVAVWIMKGGGRK